MYQGGLASGIQGMARSQSAHIGVAVCEGANRVMALERIEAGSLILEVHGVFVDRPSKYSLQVEEHLHVDLPRVEGLTADPERHAWRYLNHSCNPNAAVVGLRLVALRAIERWEEVTFNYNTTEFEIASAFRCECAACGGRDIRGFRHLSREEQAALAPLLADHLRRRLGGHGAA
jgi:hypothetical protein